MSDAMVAGPASDAKNDGTQRVDVARSLVPALPASSCARCPSPQALLRFRSSRSFSVHVSAAVPRNTLFAPYFLLGVCFVADVLAKERGRWGDGAADYRGGDQPGIHNQ